MPTGERVGSRLQLLAPTAAAMNKMISPTRNITINIAMKDFSSYRCFGWDRERGTTTKFITMKTMPPYKAPNIRGLRWISIT
jgi:hypothetical protein